MPPLPTNSKRHWLSPKLWPALRESVVVFLSRRPNNPTRERRRAAATTPHLPRAAGFNRMKSSHEKKSDKAYVIVYMDNIVLLPKPSVAIVIKWMSVWVVTAFTVSFDQTVEFHEEWINSPTKLSNCRSDQHHRHHRRRCRTLPLCDSSVKPTWIFWSESKVIVRYCESLSTRSTMLRLSNWHMKHQREKWHCQKKEIQIRRPTLIRRLTRPRKSFFSP